MCAAHSPLRAPHAAHSIYLLCTYRGPSMYIPPVAPQRSTAATAIKPSSRRNIATTTLRVLVLGGRDTVPMTPCLCLCLCLAVLAHPLLPHPIPLLLPAQAPGSWI